MATTDPIIRLRPKKDAPYQAGAPWVYTDQVVLDRRTRALGPGTVVRVENALREPLGLAAFNADSRIVARRLDHDPAASIDVQWFQHRLQTAIRLRDDLYGDPYYRLVHAEADGLPGIVIDRFGEAVVVQPNAAWADVRLDMIGEALLTLPGITTMVLNGQSRVRGLEGLPERLEVLTGSVTAPVPVPMNGATYLADLTGGQKTGLFYDQRENQRFVSRVAEGRDVLDVFCHVGGFGLAALANGARHVRAVDSSAAALALAEKGAALSGVEARFETLKGDAFDVLHALNSESKRFGIVICDPPAFAPAKAALDAGLRAYGRVARLAAKLVEPGGYLCVCSCSHAASLEQFRAVSIEGVQRARRAAQIIYTGAAAPDHPVHPALAESSYLKALVMRLN